MSTNDPLNEWEDAGYIEPVAAEEVDEGECAYEDCDFDADYRVQVEGRGGQTATTLMCDVCSCRNAIWVKENELLDNEVTVQ